MTKEEKQVKVAIRLYTGGICGDSLLGTLCEITGPEEEIDDLVTEAMGSRKVTDTCFQVGDTIRIESIDEEVSS